MKGLLMPLKRWPQRVHRRYAAASAVGTMAFEVVIEISVAAVAVLFAPPIRRGVAQ